MSVTMNTEGVRQRIPPTSVAEKKEQEKKIAEQQHPGGDIKHGTWDQALRMILFGLYFNGICLV